MMVKHIVISCMYKCVSSEIKVVKLQFCGVSGAFDNKWGDGRVDRDWLQLVDAEGREC